jgi:hypothetical protein
MNEEKRKRIAGGAATAAGMNFQAAITTIANIYMSRQRPLGWMPTALRDVPVAIEVETGSGGDDLRLSIEGGKTLEIQAKKGLARGAKLWAALMALANVINKCNQTYGLLAVSATSSGIIRAQLASDVMRIGDGCTDGFSEIGLELIEKLKAAAFDPESICKRLRIYTVPALTHDDSAVTAAKSELTHICQTGEDIDNAWNALYADAARLIEQRGRRDISSVLRILSVANIHVDATERTSQIAVLNKLSRFNFEVNATFSIFGVEKALQTDQDWIELTAVIRDPKEAHPESLVDALRAYHAWESRTANRDADTVDPETLARFVKRGVLVAGPGMGKTTLLKRIARRYSEEFIPVLKVRLGSVAARMRNGAGFEEAVFQLGLDGSGLSVHDARNCRFSNWLLLCDGLDECGSLQASVAAGVAQFATGYPECRIIVTTRPVGYRATHFVDWRHYDLTSLSTSAAAANAARLVKAITDDGSAIHTQAWETCRKELKDGPNTEIIGRTPLLLGLAAAIISNGSALANSREALFEQIFELIDSVADTRAHDRPTAPAVLRRFINVLGWQLSKNPLTSVKDALLDCAKVLADDLQIPLLQAEANAQTYAAYWEQVGLIETLGFDSKTTFAFIHKSFGEFAAARFICSLSDLDQTAFIAKNVGTEAWSEPLRFAASMGLSDKVADHFIASYRHSESGFEQLTEMLRIIAEAREAPRLDLRTEICALAFKVVGGNRTQLAYKIGKLLARVAKRFPLEIGILSTPHLTSQLEWASNVAWHCAVAAGPQHYSLDGLISTLERYVADERVRTRISATGGLILDLGNERDMTQDFALAACAELMDRAPASISDELVPKILNHPSFGAVGFVIKAQELVQAKGKSYKIGSLDGFNSNRFGPSDEYLDAELLAVLSILDLIGANTDATENAPLTRPLLNLSAFFEASSWMKMPASDFWHWSESYDVEATRAVIRTFISVCKINPVALQAEATEARRHVEEEGRKKERYWSCGLFDVITEVDPGPINWSDAKSFSIAKLQIEAALFHPSKWLVWMAVNLLNELVEPDERASTVTRLFDLGSGHTLWAASALASELPKEEVIQLIYERLRNPLTAGCRHLFDALARLSPPIDEQLVEALEVGIFSQNNWTACAAADLSKSLASPKAGLLMPLIERGIAYWQANEQPYPEKGGAIPNSPRDALVAAKAVVNPPHFDEIRLLLKDKRHDIRKVGEDQLMARVSTDESARLALLTDVLSGEVASRYMADLLKADIAFGEAELALIHVAFESANENVRFSAMGAINAQYFDVCQSRAIAEKMKTDSDHRIKERAFSILDGLDV